MGSGWDGKFFRHRRSRRRPGGISKTCRFKGTHTEKHVYGQKIRNSEKGDQNMLKNEVLRIVFPIVENVRTSSEIVLHTSRGLQLPYREKSTIPSIFIEHVIFLYFFRYIWPSLLSAYAGLYIF